eukprot:549307_1
MAMFRLVGSVSLLIAGLSGTALDCYNNVYGDGEQQTIQDVQLGLSIATSVFSIAGDIYPKDGPNPFSLAADVIDIANYATGYYGDSISDDRSIWACLDGYIQEVVGEIYDDITSFEEQKAQQSVNDLLKPINNLALNHHTHDDQLRIALCSIVKTYMNAQTFGNWDFCQKLGCNSDLYIKYYYSVLPFLVQYINLRFDTMAWLYNSSNIIECELSGPHQFDASFELYAFYQDTRDLFKMYLNALPYLIYDVNVNSGLSEKRRSNYYITNYGSPSILCKWFKTSFAIYQNSIDYENNLGNDTQSDIIDFDLDWANFAGFDFSMFEQDCDSAVISWIMLSIQSDNGECIVPDTYRAGKGAKTQQCHIQNQTNTDATKSLLANGNFAIVSIFMLYNIQL